MNGQTWPNRLLLLGSVLALAAGGCQFIGTISPPGEGPEEGIRIESLILEGTTQDPCAVEVKDTPDQDGADDQLWKVEFLMGECNGSGCLAADKGAQQEYGLHVTATRTSDDKVFDKTVTITLYD